MSVRILVGSALDVLRGLESESVQCVVTSPPYYALRDYGVDGQIGLEQTLREFLEALWTIFDDVRRVLRPDGLCFVNIGDSYAGSGKGPSNSLQRPASCLNDRQLSSGAPPKAWIPIGDGLKPKDLNLIPQRFAIGMQDRGWWVRSEIAWCKTSAMPESVRDRPTSAWEPIWMFAKSARYFYDAEAVRQPSAPARVARMRSGWNGEEQRGYVEGPQNHLSKYIGTERGRELAAAGANLRNYWLLGPEPSRDEHYAAYPTEIPRRCILAGTSEKGACPACGAPWVRVVEREPGFQARRQYEGGTRGRRMGAATDSDYRGVGITRAETTGWAPSCSCDAGTPVAQTVLDPFLGSGTTAMVADRLGRDAIGIELNEQYAELSRKRIASDAGGLFADPVSVERPVQPSLLGVEEEVAS